MQFISVEMNAPPPLGYVARDCDEVLPTMVQLVAVLPYRPPP
jgi:hypothetical protein